MPPYVFVNFRDFVESWGNTELQDGSTLEDMGGEEIYFLPSPTKDEQKKEKKEKEKEDNSG